MKDDAEETFKQIDKNSDGSLSLEEVKAWAESRRGKRKEGDKKDPPKKDGDKKDPPKKDPPPKEDK